MLITTPDIQRRWKNLPGEPVGDAGDPYTGYDRFGRTERMRWIKPSGEGYDSLIDVQWGYNRASLKTWRKDLLAPASAGQDQHIGYDGLYQVTERQRGLLNVNTTAVGGIPAQVENFNYDETGNWVSYRQSNNGELDINESRVNNRSNQITQVDGSSAGVKYDKNGNMLLVPTGDGLTGPSRKLVWDAWNRLRKVSDESDEVIAEYEYDGSSRRTMTQADGTTRRYYYNDQWRSVEERINGETPAECQHVWHPINRWEMLLRDRGGERYYPLKDQLDVVALCDSAGAVQERYDYRAFGGDLVLNADFTPMEEPGIMWDFLFHAEFVDQETSWYNYGYRYYVPTLGRWLSRDLIREEGGLNLYEMVGNGTVSKWDNLGLIGGAGIGGPQMPGWPGYNPIPLPMPEDLPPTSQVTNEDGTVQTKVNQCNIVVFFGHNGLVPQGTILNARCSAAARVSCGGGVNGTNPGVPQIVVPRAPVIPHNLHAHGILPFELFDQAWSAAKEHAKTICANKEKCCKKVIVSVDCSGLSFQERHGWLGGLFGSICKTPRHIEKCS